MGLTRDSVGPGGEGEMTQPDQLYRDFEALQERLSCLNHASLRINEGLDFDAARRNRLDDLRRKLGEDAGKPKHM